MKIYYTLTFLVVFGTTFNCNGQKKIIGNGEQTTRTITTSDYHHIELESIIDAVLVNGNDTEITIITDSNIQPYVDIKAQSKKLVVSTKDNVSLQPKSGIKVIIPIRYVNQISSLGTGDIENKGFLSFKKLRLDLSGTGDIELDLKSDEIDASLSGTGDIELEGTTNTLNISLSGTGDFKGTDLSANDVNVTLSGTGNIDITTHKSLNANNSGTGDINYKGNPSNTRINNTGTGDIREE